MISANRAVALKLILAAAVANRTVHMYGVPASSKSALARDVAGALSKRLIVFRGSQHMPEDAGGYPTADLTTGMVRALPLEEMAAACDEACVLFLDEYTTAALAMRAAILQVVDERRIGNRPLHPDTVVILASNPESQSVGGIAETLPERNRTLRFELRITRQEWCAWLLAQANAREEEAPIWSALARDIAATVDVSPDLLQLDPPQGIEASNEGWASPRAWHIAIDTLAAHVASGGTVEDAVGQLILASTVNETIAAAYLGIRKLRGSLPSVDTIVSSADKCALPLDTAASIAALGVIAEVGRRDAAAAWIYAGRLNDEIKLAAINVCAGMPLEKCVSPFLAAAKVQRMSLLAQLNAAKSGR